MDKEDVVYLYEGVLLTHKKEWLHAICDNKNGPRVYYASEISQTKTIPYDFTYMQKLKNKTNEQTDKTEMDP